MKRVALLFGAAAVLAWLPAGAVASWYEDFDSYTAGTVLDDVGGWYGWDDVSSVAGVVSDTQAYSAPNSIAIDGGDGDAVHPFTPITEGQWTFTAWQYVPSDLDALTYFIINNEYQHGGPHDWAIENHYDPSLGLVWDQIRDPDILNPLPLIYDQWTEIRVEIDLDTNFMEQYYDGDLLSSGTWNIYAGGVIAIANVDLYAPHFVEVYYDDLSLVPEPTAGLLLLAGAVAVIRRR